MFCVYSLFLARQFSKYTSYVHRTIIKKILYILYYSIYKTLHSFLPLLVKGETVHGVILVCWKFYLTDPP